MWIISTVNSFNGSAMKKSEFSDSQIMAILKQAEATVNFFNSIKQYLIKSYTIIDVLPLHLRTKMNSEISLVH